ncbi:ead/Ea22-like family protein [Klebsiella pneumoniae]|uniref:ead/Ea22-like family protein n=1 Tax=Klebsiella pneumoniae TaxID=573 RepID=UPI002109FDDB|nr:ead/Ea22-like family protein [Klebsiella pneumoniae]MCQ4002933.1 ead/Ea22-like family protein [Klebsiella pneumoniae]
MTTDITELAQSLKAAATNVKETAHIARYLKATIARQTFKELMTPDNILALVEALEKAQQRIGKLEKKLTDHKRMNQEMAKAMLTPNDSDAAGMEIAALRQRIAKLESSSVKLPKPYAYLRENDGQIQISIGSERPSDRSGGYATPWFAIYTAAGIKVEGE